MKLIQLLNKANKGYPDKFLSNFYSKTGKLKRFSGDGLARFIVTELIETFDPDASDREQVSMAIKVLRAGQHDLEGVIKAIAPPWAELQVTLNIAYSEGVSLKLMSDVVEQGIIQAVDQGLFTGDTAAELDTWEIEIRKIRK